MSLAIAPDGIATVLTGERDATTRVYALARDPGFVGAVLLKAVGPFRKTIAYVAWSTTGKAAAQGDGPRLRAMDVRERPAPLDRRATVPLARDGVALVLRWEVDSARCDELLAELQDFTDDYFPTSDGIFSAAFHVPDDRTVVAEYLQAQSVWTVFRIQFDRSMRRHQRAVKRLVRTTDIGLYRICGVLERGQGKAALLHTTADRS